MIIDVPKVSPDGSRYEGEEIAKELDLGENNRVRITSPIRYDLFVQKVSDELVVSGTLSIDLSTECVRCAEFFSTSLVDLSFLRAYEIPEGVETVDLTPDFREDILLELPAYPLCSPDCKGLCPHCGKNLNGGACGCSPSSEGGQWTALGGLNL